MKYTKKRKKIIHTRLKRALWGLVFITTGIWGYYSLKKLFTPSNIVITFKDIYSDDLKKDINLFVNQYLAGTHSHHALTQCDYGNLDLDDFFLKLKDRFKVIKRADWHWDTFERAVITVEGIKPSFRVNKHLIFGNKRRLFHYSLFSNATCDSLRTLVVNPDIVEQPTDGCRLADKHGKVPEDVYKFVQQLPEDYWHSYSISYSGQNCVFLQDRESQKSSQEVNALDVQLVVKGYKPLGLGINVSSGEGFDLVDKRFEQKIKTIDLVHNDFMIRKGHKQRLSRWWRRKNKAYVEYDLRFKDRIYAKVVKKKRDSLFQWSLPYKDIHLTGFASRKVELKGG